jgi:NAD(P)H dehydrogenase (quinone)
MTRLTDPTRLLLVFYSRTGSAEALAKAAEEGACSQGATVRMYRAREVVDPATMEKSAGWLAEATRQNAPYEELITDDAEWADAILFGTPC